MPVCFDTAHYLENGIVSSEPLKIYTGILGRIGDIIMFTATVRRLRELFPNSSITFAVSRQFRTAGELVAGLPYIDRLFITEYYFERMTQSYFAPWHLGWPVDLRGEDERAEQQLHDVVFETRPRHRRMPWWDFDHQVAESAHMIGVPGPIDLRTDVAIPPGTVLPTGSEGKIVIHNDPAIDHTKHWPWACLQRLVKHIGSQNVVLLGNPGPEVVGAIDLRGRTTLAEAAAIIERCHCYVGIDSGLMWIAGSLRVPTVGLYGTSYVKAYGAIQPRNPRAIYIQCEGTLDHICPEAVLEEIYRAAPR